MTFTTKKAAKAKRAEMIGKVKGAVKKVGSALKSGAKAAYKGANRAAGYAAGAAGREFCALSLGPLRRGCR